MAVKQSKLGQAGHTAGIFADMSLDGPEIGTLVAVVDRARNLPNRKTMGKQDPYCAMRLGKEAKKTETDRRGGQVPKWDQELRFTVHESPDYYRLKCSVFNDDKKTDLIGEAWIDLKEVIVPGGGQNDLWHQLQCKGKYAGEIRMEMTYYDTRPKDESVAGKRKEKDRRDSTATSSPAGAGGSRQLGPREIKRRPLPASPAGSSVVNQPSDVAPAEATPPPRSAGRPAYNDQVAYTTLAYDGRQSMGPGHPHGLHSDDHGYNQDYPQDYPQEEYPVEQYQQIPQPQALPRDDFDERPGYYGPSTAQHVYEPNQPHYHDDPAEINDLRYSTARPPPSAVDVLPSRNDAPPMPISPYTPTWSPITSHHSSPQDLPQPSPSNSEQRQLDYRQPVNYHRHSTSPIKNISYRDSPLRQSVSNYEMPSSHDAEEDFTPDADPVPPPPPLHRYSLSQAAPQSAPSSVGRIPPTQQMIPRIPVHRSSIEPRSPLQNIEQTHDPTLYSSPPTMAPQEQLPMQYQDYSRDSYDAMANYPGQPLGFMPAETRRRPAPSQRSGSYGSVKSYPEPAYQDDRRRSATLWSPQGEQPMAPSGRERPQSYYPPILQDESRAYSPNPPLFKPRAISPNARNAPPRNSVSPQPQLDYDRQLGHEPFGPDAYDSLNPVMSNLTAAPAVVARQAEEVNEEERQREVNRLRDPGPIIGNDGRVIDPSDHLPADTWAPEPERKERKPEHVIRFKTKDQANRTPNGPASSPHSQRPHSYSTPLHASSPNSVDSPISPSTRPPGRNRLQKQMPARPLPVQPFQHPHSSPAIPSVNRQYNNEAQHTPSPRTTMSSQPIPRSDHNTPSPRGHIPPRPALSDYPIFNSSPHVHHAHVPYYTDSPPVPAKVPLNHSSPYNDFSGLDPLSAELRSIDIGPRGGRSGIRGSWGNRY